MSFPSPSSSQPPALANWQFSYNGLTMGEGTPYGFATVAGLLDLPAIRSADVPRPRDQGELPGLDFMSGRDTVLTGDVVSNGSSLQSSLLALAAATAPSETELPLWFQLPNLPLLATMCRCRKRTIPLDIAYSAGIATSTLGFHATDPRIYAVPQSSLIGVPAPPPGIGFPVSFSVSFGGGSEGSFIGADNAGDFEMRPLFIFTGPCTTPRVVSVTTGAAMVFNITLDAGDTLTVDTDLHSILLVTAGTVTQVNRRNCLASGSSWIRLLPGSNEIAFTTEDGSAVAGTMSLQWASAYLL